MIYSYQISNITQSRKDLENSLNEMFNLNLEKVIQHELQTHYTSYILAYT